jgi:hypothetical protein
MSPVRTKEAKEWCGDATRLTGIEWKILQIKSRFI